MRKEGWGHIQFSAFEQAFLFWAHIITVVSIFEINYYVFGNGFKWLIKPKIMVLETPEQEAQTI